MRPILALLASLVVSISSLTATPQESDTLIHNGASYPVIGFRFGPGLDKKLYHLARNDGRWIHQSSLWRGYTAVLQVRDGRLYLIGIDFNCREPKPSVKEILGFEIPDGGVPADFYTGELFHGFGDTWGYMHESASGERRKQIRNYAFEAGVLKGISEISTDKPTELIRERVMKDIEMLTEVITEVDPNDPFLNVKPKDEPDPAKKED